MIKRPPKRALVVSVLDNLAQKYPDKIGRYLEYYQPVDSKGRYLPYDEFQYRVTPGLEIDSAWTLTKSARAAQYLKLLPLGDNNSYCNFNLTPSIQKTISHADRHTTKGSLEWMCGNIALQRQQYSLQAK